MPLPLGLSASDLITAGSGIVGLLSNWLGGDADAQKLEKLKAYITAQKIDIEKMTAEQEAKIRKYASSLKSERSRQATQKAYQFGLDPVSIPYSAIKDIDVNTQQAIENAEIQKRQELRELDRQLMAGELSLNPQTGIERGVEGLFAGAEIGAKISNVLNLVGKPKGKDEKDTGDKTTGDNKDKTLNTIQTDGTKLNLADYQKTMTDPFANNNTTLPYLQFAGLDKGKTLSFDNYYSIRNPELFKLFNQYGIKLKY
jgi:hypothetical protein